jgi:hypothetical protein
LRGLYNRRGASSVDEASHPSQRKRRGKTKGGETERAERTSRLKI